MSTSTQTPPADFVLRIALLLGVDKKEELNPSIYRTFRCSSGINLDVFQDKVLQPIFGWTRNYHTYYIWDKGHKVTYYQDKSGAADADVNRDVFEHHRKALKNLRDDADKKVNPLDFTLYDLFSKSSVVRGKESTKGNKVYYAYDLGDHWFHSLEIEKIMYTPTSDQEDEDFGKVKVLDGAMRCPPEDGEGGWKYQEKTLDLYNQSLKPNQALSDKREYAEHLMYEGLTCAPNVRGLFNPAEFSIEETQQRVQEALHSNLSFRFGTKMPSGLNGFPCTLDRLTIEPGQRKICRLWEDTRFGPPSGPGDEGFYVSLCEIINVKPDDAKLCLCANCGNPFNFMRCGGCHTHGYCSAKCQKSHWKVHKPKCKKDKAYYQEYLLEKDGKKKVPQDSIPGGKFPLKRYDQNNMRFKVGVRVECMVGPTEWARGTVVKVLDEYPEGRFHAYQVKLDPPCRPPYNLIWAEWDNDCQIRGLEDESSLKSRKKKGNRKKR